ncbi:uncharacterized protein BCR38DRAFT_410515 [Pseudomassariella vexata]|uniref:Uncharacterized protein n=1 Tax=Pseudomassariella vexata TaxID=1141098 RepID=A0A1Y2DS50_9PEZI|nr:uncharacterized protein BCR38DRAFT_410515 [Pseudomassariella vexata]ORY62067.1 hypothetical protein BCR38DRAFT_410515 [Pseudomassariella vexata]
MSNDKNDSAPNDMGRNRRGSVTSAAFSNLFQRSNSTSTGSNNGPGSLTAQARDQRRRLSVTTLGLSGTGPASASTPFGSLRRGSISTNTSDSIDENAVDDDDSLRTAPTTPFVRRMSFGAQAMRSMRQPGGGTSPGSAGRPDQPRRSSGSNGRNPPLASFAARRTSNSQASTALPARTPSDLLSSAARPDQGFNWSEQLRSRAESSVSGMRPSFAPGIASSPPRAGNGQHDRAKSVSDMPAPPQQAAALKPKQPERPKPDHMQERILKGDFYMD